MLKKYLLTAGIFLAFCFGLMSSGCNNDDQDNETTTTTTVTASNTTSISAGGIALDKPLPEPASAKQELAFSINMLGIDLYAPLAQKNSSGKNIVFSPYSISNCLAMIYAGARSTTEQQMTNVLHYTLAQQVLHETFGSLNTDMLSANHADNTTDYTLKLNIDNSGWFEKNSSFLTSYTDTLSSKHKAEVAYVDYKNNPEAARQEINQWASGKTQGKITELLPMGLVDSSIRLVAVNTIYFKGTWSKPFNESSTAPFPFHLLDGTEKNVSMMQQQGIFEYAATNVLQAVTLRYFGTLAMIIVVPDSGKFNTVTGQIKAGGLYSIIHNMNSTSLYLKFPKYHARTNYSVKDDLSALGMTDVFSQGLADLSGIDGNKNNLYLSFVIHEAVIDVDEKGTEAAAATAGGVAPTSMDPSSPIDFTIDRPFLFAVYDTNTDAVLFMGSVLDPSQTE